MQPHNITQAQIMKDEDDDQRLERGGLSTVNVGPRTQYRQVNFENWVVDLTDAICRFFDSYCICGNGFRDDAQLYSKLGLASQWRLCEVQPLPWGRAWTQRYSQSRTTGRAAKENEAKSAAATTPVDKFMETDRGEDESEDISDNDSVLADFDNEDSDKSGLTASFEAELEKFVQAKSSASKDQITSEPEQAEWASTMQLTIYRQNVAKITKDVLKANNVQLCARKKTKRSVKDKKQYAQGGKDSNVRVTRI